MESKTMRLIFYSVAILVLAGHFRSVLSQGHLFSHSPEDGNESNDPMRMFRKMLGGLMTMGQEAHNRMSSGPGVYDMVKNDTELGINVMSGLVKFDRVREPGKPRSLSVRVFGIPVFNRGFKQDDVLPTDRRSGSGNEVDLPPGGSEGGGNVGSGSSNGGSKGEEEDLPLE